MLLSGLYQSNCVYNAPQPLGYQGTSSHLCASCREWQLTQVLLVVGAQVDYVDIWSHYTPYPFNQIPRSYSFMVAHPALWKINYYLQQPRWVHVPTQRMWAPFVSRQARGRPRALASAHPPKNP